MTADSLRLSWVVVLIHRLAALVSPPADDHMHPQHRSMPFFSASGD